MINIDLVCISGQDILNEYSEDVVSSFLSTFSCPLEPFIEEFVQNKCISAEKIGKTRSYFIIDFENKQPLLLGYFALTLKILYLKQISKKKASSLHLSGNTEQRIPAYYIALLAKNQTYKDQIDGKVILDNAVNIIETAADHVGNHAIWLEAKKQNAGVMAFYLSNKFKEFQEETQDDGTYSHLVRKI